MSMQQTLTDALGAVLRELKIEGVAILLEHPGELSHGDYSSNVAMVAAKKLGKNPRELADEMVQLLKKDMPEHVEKVEVAGPGFINFHLTRAFFKKGVEAVNAKAEEYGKSKLLQGQNIIVEYTTQNVLKQFHIGHLMTNSIGESLSRILEAVGATVKRNNYQGDVGLHVAKALWGIQKLQGDMPAAEESVQVRSAFLGKAYALGAGAYEEDSKAQEEIKVINKSVYEKGDPALMKLYDTGRAWSLEHFENLYKLLGTHFDFLFFESAVAERGKETVLDGLKNGVFEKSDGAVIYNGAHTRVFLNAQGLPTYEAKELGLAQVKHDAFPYDQAIIFTDNEQSGYFAVVREAMEEVIPELAKKIRHIAHGKLRLAEGKMSSRTGKVIPAEDLIQEAKCLVLERMEVRGVDDSAAEKIAVAAIKYSVLKQSPNKDIIFDIEKSLSLEGDSGPYLQYTYARIQSVLEKGRIESIVQNSIETVPEVATDVEKILYRFPEVVERAAKEYAPQLVVHFLTELASRFNSFYAKEKIVDRGDEYSPYKLALAAAVAQVLKNGLWVLGIGAPERM